MSDIEFGNSRNRNSEKYIFEPGAHSEIEIYNLTQYPEVCKMFDRSKTSNRDICFLTNSVLLDLNNDRKDNTFSL